MNDLTLTLCEMLNEPSEYFFALKKEHPRVYEALVVSYKRQQLFQSLETIIYTTKEDITNYGEESKKYLLRGRHQTYTVPYIESYEAYEKVYNDLVYEKKHGIGSGVAGAMSKGIAGEKLNIFQKHYQGYEARRQAYLV